MWQVVGVKFDLLPDGEFFVCQTGRNQSFDLMIQKWVLQQLGALMGKSRNHFHSRRTLAPNARILG